MSLLFRIAFAAASFATAIYMTTPYVNADSKSVKVASKLATTAAAMIANKATADHTAAVKKVLLKSLLSRKCA
jgi:hypothetical protein